MPNQMGFFDVIYTTRAIRVCKSDPVSPGIVRQLLEAATQAPSGINRQPWRFLLVDDPSLKREVGEYHRQGGGGVQSSDASSTC